MALESFSISRMNFLNPELPFFDQTNPFAAAIALAIPIVSRAWHLVCAAANSSSCGIVRLQACSGVSPLEAMRSQI